MSVKLHLGCGNYPIPGWNNYDITPTIHPVEFIDVTQRLPFDTDSVDCIFHEHLIEHLTFDEGLAFIAECHRVLRPGGWLRIATPCLDNLISIYGMGTVSPAERASHPDSAALKTGEALAASFLNYYQGNPCQVLNRFFHDWGHKFIYDKGTLDAALSSVGFDSIQQTTADYNLDQHWRTIGKVNNEMETMVFIAWK